MNTQINTLVRQGSVRAPLMFLEAEPGGDKPKVYSASTAPSGTRRTGTFSGRLVEIADARGAPVAPTLDVDGFELRPHRSEVTDFLDAGQLREVFYAEATALLKQATGASKALIFDHTIRIEDEQARGAYREPVQIVHNDYTERSGPQRVADLLPAEEAAVWLAHRFAIVNVWRSIGGPVTTTPLAFADAGSLDHADLIASDLVYAERTGEIYQVAYNPAQRWHYYPDLSRDETLLLKVFDSSRDGRARWTAHTAFTNPDVRAGAEPRRSMELRALLSFAPQGELGAVAH